MGTPDRLDTPSPSDEQDEPTHRFVFGDECYDTEEELEEAGRQFNALYPPVDFERAKQGFARVAPWAVARRQKLSTLKHVAEHPDEYPNEHPAFVEELARRQAERGAAKSKPKRKEARTDEGGRGLRADQGLPARDDGASQAGDRGEGAGEVKAEAEVEAEVAQQDSSREESDPVELARQEMREGYALCLAASGELVETIIALGDLVRWWREGPKKLTPNQWRALFKDDDPFGENKAYQLKAIAECEVMRKNARHLPPHIRTLHLIAQEVKDDPQRLQRAIDEKRITPDSSARDVREQLSKGSGRTAAGDASASAPAQPDEFEKYREIVKFNKAVGAAINHWMSRCPQGLDDEDNDWRLFPEDRLRELADDLEIERRVVSPLPDSSREESEGGS